MTLGLSLSAFTILHVLISLVAIVSGLVVVWGLTSGRKMPGLTATFLVTTVLTSITGFGFPFSKLLPSHILGIISLVFLAIAILALYSLHLSGAWRWVYVVCAVLSLYLNVFVLVVQCFKNVPVLKSLAPTQSEPPFAIAQLLVLLVFSYIGFLSVKRFHPVTV